MNRHLGFIADAKLIDAALNEHLKEVARDESGWTGLFTDLETGDFWLHEYPQGERHGGGLATVTRLLRPKVIPE